VNDIIEDFYSYVVEKLKNDKERFDKKPFVEKLKNDKERFDKKPLEFHYEIHTEDSDDSHYSIVMKVSFWRKR